MTAIQSAAQARDFAPYAQLKPAPHGSVRWTQGFWADRFALCHEVIVPSMRQALDDPTNGAMFSNLFVAAGLQEGKHQGTFWSDGDCYKWMETAAYIVDLTGDKELDATLDELIDVIAKAQDADGYICTQVQLTDKERWQAPRHHELYNMGHLMTAAYVHHRATGKQNFLAVARKLADYLYATFAPKPPELAHFPWNPSNIMGLVDLYRVTGEARYLELAGIFVDMRGSIPRSHQWSQDYRDNDGTDQNQDRVPLRQEDSAVGHAVTATYLYCGATDVYQETGEEALRHALERIWANMNDRKMYITGGVGAHHHAVSNRGDKVWEAFGYDYELPNARAYNETCANIGNGMWNWRMLQIAGEAKYADLMEQVIYNSGLSGMSIDGKHFCYTNPLRWYGADHEILSQDSPARWFTFHCYCCPPSVARGIARMHEWVYSTSPEGIWVHLFGGSTLETTAPDGSAIRLEQTTDYPWDGQVRITVQGGEGAAPQASLGTWSLHVRIPAWAEDATLYVNGAEAGVALQPGSYACVERRWSTGDTVELALPLQPRLVCSHPRVEETRNHLAVMVGPLVYCLEGTDLPDGVDLAEVYLPRTMKLTARYAPDLLGGVAVVEGEAQRVRESNGNRLYDAAHPAQAQPLPIRLIPYYAWNNRGATTMSVWLPAL